VCQELLVTAGGEGPHQLAKIPRITLHNKVRIFVEFKIK
jgi:hypothetical protein